MGKYLYAFVMVALLSGCSSISLSESDLLEKAKQSGEYSLPPKAEKIFADAEKASGSCKLEDAKWIEYTTWDGSKEPVYKEGRAFKRDAGTITMFYDDGERTYLGNSTKSQWGIQNDIHVSLPLRKHHVIFHIVDNWLAYCPPYKHIWRGVSVSEERIHGKAAYRITAIEPYYDTPVSFWFGKKSKLLVAREYTYDSKRGAMTLRDEFSDFRKVKGIKIPFKMVQYKDSERWATVKYTDVAVNTGISASRFAAPSEY